MRKEKEKLRLEGKRVVVALLSGWLAVLLTPHSMVLDNIYHTRFIWPLLFPLLVSVAWEPVYAYIAGLGGAVFLSPFLEMPARGWGNLLIAALYLLLLILCGHLCNRPQVRCNYYLLHVLYAVLYAAVVLLAYPYVLLCNPENNSFQRFASPMITRVQVITFVFCALALAAFVKVMLSIPAVRRVLWLPPLPYSQRNSSLFATSLFVVAGFMLVDRIFEAFYFSNRGLHTSILSSSFNSVIKLPIVFAAACIICDAIISSTMKNLESHDKLMKSEERYRMIFMHSTDTYLEIDSSGTILQVNPAIYSTLNFTPEHVRGQNIRRLFSEEQDIDQLLEQLFREGKINNIEILGHADNDERSVLLVSANLLYLGDQQLAVLSARNISDYKKAEAKRWELAALLGAIFESNRDFIWTVDSETFALISFNQAFARYIRDVLGREIGSGATLTQIFPGAEGELFAGYYRQVLEQGDFSVEYEAPQGGLILDINFYPVRLQEKISSIAAFTKNISAQKSAERRIIELNEGLEQTVEERTQELRSAYRDLESFSYTMTHELKTPIREIDTYLEIIQEDNYDLLMEQSKHDIQSARKVCSQTLDMIEKMMFYAKAGFMVLNIEQIDMEEMVRDCCNDLRQSLESKQIELTMYPLPLIYADRFLLRVAVMNIVSNSVKFARPDQPVSLVVGHMRSASRITYYFRDHGVGFSDRASNDLFTLFARAHNNSEYEGNGIGLALIKRILNRHGGRVDICSEPGKGCVVSFSFRSDFQQLE